MPRLHRAYTYYLLKQLPWFDNIFLSFSGLNLDTVEITLDQINTTLGSDIANFFASELINFPITHESEYQWTNCHDADTTAYTASKK